MEKKDNYKIIIAIAVIAVAIITIGGSTFAYWQWVSGATNQTNVSVKVEDSISMTITPTTKQTNVLYPISDAACNTASISGSAVVRISNNTGIKAKPTFKLKIKIIDSTGANITNTTVPGTSKKYAEYIRYAVSETSKTTCSDNGNLVIGSFTSTQTPNHTDWNDSASLGTAVTFQANGKTTVGGTAVVTNHTYNFWAWIDSTYQAQNIGNVVSDKLQNAKITISWSESSTVTQIA